MSPSFGLVPKMIVEFGADSVVGFVVGSVVGSVVDSVVENYASAENVVG